MIDDDSSFPDWRDCSLHALRLMHVSLLYSVLQHKRRITEGTWPRDHADDELWEKLVKHNFTGENDG